MPVVLPQPQRFATSQQRSTGARGTEHTNTPNPTDPRGRKWRFAESLPLPHQTLLQTEAMPVQELSFPLVTAADDLVHSLLRAKSRARHLARRFWDLDGRDAIQLPLPEDRASHEATTGSWRSANRR